MADKKNSDQDGKPISDAPDADTPKPNEADAISETTVTGGDTSEVAEQLQNTGDDTVSARDNTHDTVDAKALEDAPTADETAAELTGSPETPDQPDASEGDGRADSLPATSEGPAAATPWNAEKEDAGEPVVIAGTLASDQTTGAADDEPSSKPGPETMPAPVEVVERVIERKGGGFPAVLGGIIAAALGFLVASTDVLEPYLPFLASNDSAETYAALEEDIAAQETRLDSRISELDTQIQSIEVPDISGLNAAIEEAAASAAQTAPLLSDLSDRMAALETRFSELEKRPISEGVSEAAIAAYEAELAALQSSVAEQRAEIETMIADARAMESEAAAARQTSAALEAIAEIRAAMESGAAFEDALQTLEAGTGVDVPDPVANLSDTGVPTLASLQASFPEAARAALDAARRDTDGNGGVGTFFLRQLGARSVEPREGNDPDAVLSRMQGDVTAGDLRQALAEFEALPEASQAALAAWVAQARARLDAVTAADSLAQRLKNN